MPRRAIRIGVLGPALLLVCLSWSCSSTNDAGFGVPDGGHPALSDGATSDESTYEASPGDVRVVSENGGAFTLANPWSAQSMVVYRNGVNVGNVSGATVTIQTCANDSIFLAPQGTSYASILTVLNAY